MYRKFNKILLLLIIIFVFGLVSTVYADPTTPIGVGDAGKLTGSGSGNFNPYLHPSNSLADLGFRFTLVDFNGKKIDGTKSVDFTGSINIRKVDGGENLCGYKYDLSIDCSKDENKVDLQFFQNFPGPGVDFAGAKDFDIFMKTEFEDITSLKFSYKNSSGRPIATSFVDAFLHLNGFLGDFEKYNSNLSESHAKILDESIIIAEPTMLWTYKHNGEQAIYGTVTELAKRGVDNRTNHLKNGAPYNMFQSGNLDTFISSTFLCVTGAQLDYAHSLLGKKADDFFIKKGVLTSNCSVESPINYGDVYMNNAKYLVENPDVGYAIYLGVLPGRNSIKIERIDDCPNCAETNEFGLLSCDYNSSKIEYKSNSILKPQQYEELAVSSDDGIYCYDNNVLYDFSKMISSLNRNNFNVLTYVNPDSGKLNVTRKCFVKNSSLIGDQPSKNLLQELEDDYKNQVATINLYGINYDIKPTNVKTKQMTETKNFDNSGGALFTYELEADYDVERNSLFIGSDYKNNTNGTISLNNFQNAFGKSNGLLKNKTKIYINENEIVDKYDAKLDDKMKCNFSFDVTNPESEIRFRVISLENPFPGRDGTSRMPSKNWFYDNNYVYDYILNNRGIRSTLCGNLSEACLNSISPEKMYTTLEPMYSITLTPSTMLKIREYNKKYSYYSMYDTLDFAEGHGHENETVRQADKDADKLICDDQGRQCYSQFLRDDDYIPQTDGDLASGTGSISGKCVLVKNFKTKDDATVRMELSKYSFYNEETYPLLPLHKYIFNEETDEEINANLYDVNHNGRIDNEDYEIIFQYQTDVVASLPGRNTQYYTCANKSYFSGGPIDVGGDD